MYHRHLDECESTQTYIKENWDELCQLNDQVLVSTQKQTAGYGRRATNWDHYKHALAFSFTLPPSAQFTLTSLELGVLVSHFFKEKMKKTIKLKWPNDLINNDGEKCGGIICHIVGPDQKTILAGIGINLSIEQNEGSADFKIKAGGVLTEAINKTDYKKTIPAEIVEYIHQNRLFNKGICDHWNEACYHLDQVVEIIDGREKTQGVFKGIGPSGEALIETNGRINEIISGSLYLKKP